MIKSHEILQRKFKLCFWKEKKKQHKPAFNLIELINTSPKNFIFLQSSQIITSILPEDKEQFICDLINERTMFEKCQTSITSHSFH